MANTLGIDYAADHAEQERDRGLFITWNGDDYSALVSVPTMLRTFEDDGSGYFETKILTVSIRSCIISSDIKIGDKLTYSGAEYRISEKMVDEDSEWYLFSCEGLTL